MQKNLAFGYSKKVYFLMDGSLDQREELQSFRISIAVVVSRQFEFSLRGFNQSNINIMLNLDLDF